jgi:prevent-host-death family protein
MQVNMLEAKNQLSKLVKAALAGEEVIIANHGVPAVRLIALNKPAPARSLAAEMSELQQMLAEESTELALPNRMNRDNPFPAALTDEHAAD